MIQNTKITIVNHWKDISPNTACLTDAPAVILASLENTIRAASMNKISAATVQYLRYIFAFCVCTRYKTDGKKQREVKDEAEERLAIREFLAGEFADTSASLLASTTAWSFPDVEAWSGETYREVVLRVLDAGHLGAGTTSYPVTLGPGEALMDWSSMWKDRSMLLRPVLAASRAGASEGDAASRLSARRFRGGYR